jgi:tetratricopeptide (TPR) repeat protein
VDLRLETTSADPSRLGATVSVRKLSIPDRAMDLYQQAVRSLGKKDSVRAVELLEKAIEKAPQFSEALNTLGTIYNQRRDYPKAEECFREALAHSPTAFEPTVNLGGVLLAQGHLPESLQYNRKAVHARPEDALAQGQLGWVLLRLGQTEEAVEHLREAKRLDPGHFTRPQLGLAEIYARRSERGKAAAELEDYLRLHPDDPEASKMRAEIFRLRNEPN